MEPYYKDLNYGSVWTQDPFISFLQKYPEQAIIVKYIHFSVFLSEKTQLNVMMHHSLSIMKWSNTVGRDQIYHKDLQASLDLITLDRISSPHNTQRMISYSLFSSNSKSSWWAAIYS